MCFVVRERFEDDMCFTYVNVHRIATFEHRTVEQGTSKNVATRVSSSGGALCCAGSGHRGEHTAELGLHPHERHECLHQRHDNHTLGATERT